MRKTPLFEPYEAPTVDLIHLDTSCALMQESVEIPGSGDAIPDIVIEPLDWIL